MFNFDAETWMALVIILGALCYMVQQIFVGLGIAFRCGKNYKIKK